jgi:hypothetical protein
MHACLFLVFLLLLLLCRCSCELLLLPLLLRCCTSRRTSRGSALVMVSAVMSCMHTWLPLLLCLVLLLMLLLSALPEICCTAYLGAPLVAAPS